MISRVSSRSPCFFFVFCFFFLFGGQGAKKGVKKGHYLPFFFIAGGGTILGKFGPSMFSRKLRPCTDKTRLKSWLSYLVRLLVGPYWHQTGQICVCFRAREPKCTANWFLNGICHIYTNLGQYQAQYNIPGDISISIQESGEFTPAATVTRFGPKVGQIGPKWEKSGAFSDQNSVHLARGPGFVPFGANLTHFGAKPTIPAVNEQTKTHT